MLALHSSTLADVTCAVGFQLVNGEASIIEGWAEGHANPAEPRVLALRRSTLADVMCAVGFQLVDPKRHIIVVEGLVEGGMQALQEIALQSPECSLAQQYTS